MKAFRYIYDEWLPKSEYRSFCKGICPAADIFHRVQIQFCYSITLMMNHINSYSRESLGNKCPYDVFRFFYGDKLLNLLGCTTIPAQQVTLNKSVFRKEVVE